mgnify:CR=1 FL=1
MSLAPFRGLLVVLSVNTPCFSLAFGFSCWVAFALYCAKAGGCVILFPSVVVELWSGCVCVQHAYMPRLGQMRDVLWRGACSSFA